MRKRTITQKTGFSINQSVEGSTIEKVLERMLSNGEPIGNEAPLIYTERKNGVEPAYDIRTDRFDMAIDGMDKVQASLAARRAPMKIVEENEEKSGDPSQQEAQK